MNIFNTVKLLAKMAKWEKDPNEVIKMEAVEEPEVKEEKEEVE